MTGNFLKEDKENRFNKLRSWLKAAKDKNTPIDIKKLKGVFLEEYAILPSLLHKYLIELESAGEIEISKDGLTLEVI